jgi:pimeloyl-ACP methyl ester carboxylesterase
VKEKHDRELVRRTSTARFVAREALAYALHGTLGVLRRVPHPAAAVDDEATVLFVHGHGGAGGAFTLLERALRARGHHRFAAWDYRASGSAFALAEQLARFARERVGGPVHVVGHSLGGILARVWLQELGGREQARSLVTLSTPHRGLRPLPGARVLPVVREITAGSPLLERLDGGAHTLSSLRCLAVVSSRDHFVYAPDDAGFAAARLVHVHHAGHVGLLYSRRVHQLVAEHLAADPVEPPTRR